MIYDVFSAIDSLRCVHISLRDSWRLLIEILCRNDNSFIHAIFENFIYFTDKSKFYDFQCNIDLPNG